MHAPLHPDTIARLSVPPLALDGCVYAYLWRDLTGAADLADGQCLHRFPASPLCGFTWMLQGRSRQVDAHGHVGEWLPPGMVGGPRSGPMQFESTRDTRALMVAMRPEALQALTGADIGAMKDRTLPVSALGDAAWCALDAAMLATRDEAEARRTLEAFLLPRWRAVRGQVAADGPRRGYAPWIEHLALRAVAAGHGRGVRQIERRIKQWSGQSLRSLRLVGRAEATFQAVRRLEEDDGAVVWSALAHDAGYADQAHLCRETRRITGFSPEELRRLLAEDESFWPYRVWV